MKEKFLINWRGANTFGHQNQWAKAQGSSLSENELKVLNQGGIVRHQKNKSLTKIFVKDEKGNMWSVIVHVLHQTSLEKDLKNAGFIV